MVGKRRSRHGGQGMMPLFDVEAYARRDDPPAAPARPARERGAAKPPEQAAVAAPTPVDYWVRGVFRIGDGQMTRTVQAVGMSTRLDADMAKFVRYLTDEGFQFPEGRAVLIELLGTGTDTA